MDLSRKFLAEFIGTFMLVFVGAGAVVVMGTATNKVAADVVVAALAHGLILVAIIATFGHISGAHVNPAVTLGLVISGNTNILTAILYWIAQILGGIVAVALLRVIFPDVEQLGNTLPSALLKDPSLKIIILEALGTFFLVSTVHQAAAYRAAGTLAMVVIPFTLAAGILFIGPLTGASFNVARTLGPALVATDFSFLAEYIVGILIGGAAAGFLHGLIFRVNR